MTKKFIVPNVVRHFRFLVIPIEKEGGLSETHHKMHDSVILAKTDMRACSKHEPISTDQLKKTGESLWMLLGDSIRTPSGRVELLWVRVCIFIVKRVPECRENHGTLDQPNQNYTVPLGTVYSGVMGKAFFVWYGTIISTIFQRLVTHEDRWSHSKTLFNTPPSIFHFLSHIQI